MLEVPLDLLRKRPGWDAAMEAMRARLEVGGDEARVGARSYSQVYEGRRASMVFDVVASRQRRYTTRVQQMIGQFEESPAAESLEALVELGPPVEGLRKGGAETIRGVAAGLVARGVERGLDDDEATRSWADATSGLSLAHRLDPYVGTTKGIGIALFSYLRMRAGGDDIKPDVRVRNALAGLGFDPPQGEASWVLIAHGIALEIEEPLLVVDQLLWWD